MRASGILLHITSLPNQYGIGKLGKEAYDFVDFLVKSKQKIWQILPLSPTSFGDSPYQSFSIFAGNPYFISFEKLEEEMLLKKEEYTGDEWCESGRFVDYGLLYERIFVVLKKAHVRFKLSPSVEYTSYVEKNRSWLLDYALFMSLKFAHEGHAWCQWEEPLRNREPEAIAEAYEKYRDDVDFWCFLQYEFYAQWFALKKYANSKGIQIIGDIPIYAAYDSVEVWCRPELFQLDENREPIVVAGFPPDGFSPDGQLWGNPIYDWDRMKEEEYAWWVERIRFSKAIYDVVRIDHFIGFNSYYAIPFGNKTAHGGVWRAGPKYEVFQAVKASTGREGIIAEDLGIITPAVRKLMKQAGYPGMKVLQFAFSPDGKSDYLPQNYISSNCVVYTGTHDNETVAGWVQNIDKKSLKFCKEYLAIKKNAGIPWAFIELAWKSTADTAVTTMQDLWGYDNSARINVPSTVGDNWRWRALESDFSDGLAQRLGKLTELSNRT